MEFIRHDVNFSASSPRRHWRPFYHVPARHSPSSGALKNVQGFRRVVPCLTWS